MKIFIILLSQLFIYNYHSYNTSSCNLNLQNDTINNYEYETQNYRQEVTIRSIDSVQIQFQIHTIRKKDNATLIIKGAAAMSDSNNFGVDEDNNGSGYFIDIYKFTEGQCTMFLRIAAEDQSCLKIETYGCHKLMGEEEGFFTLHVLLKRANTLKNK